MQSPKAVQSTKIRSQKHQRFMSGWDKALYPASSGKLQMGGLVLLVGVRTSCCSPAWILHKYRKYSPVSGEDHGSNYRLQSIHIIITFAYDCTELYLKKQKV